jgi:hypothetical protein
VFDALAQIGSNLVLDTMRWILLESGGEKKTESPYIETMLLAIQALDRMKSKEAFKIIISAGEKGPKEVKDACGQAIKRRFDF